MSNYLLPRGLQLARLPCPPMFPSLLQFTAAIELVMLSNYFILCYPFFSCPQSFPASGSFPMSQLFTPGGQSIGASASMSVLPMNIQGWFSLGLAWLPSSPRDSQESSLVPQFKSINSSVLSLFCGPIFTSVHNYWIYMYMGIVLAEQSGHSHLGSRPGWAPVLLDHPKQISKQSNTQ